MTVSPHGLQQHHVCHNDSMDEVSSSGGLFPDDYEMQKNYRRIWRTFKFDKYLAVVAQCRKMEITNSRTTIRFGYCLGHTNLKWVDSFRYQGVLTDPKLKWNNHCQSIASKTTRAEIHSVNAASKQKPQPIKLCFAHNWSMVLHVWDHTHAVKNVETLAGESPEVGR